MVAAEEASEVSGRGGSVGGRQSTTWIKRRHLVWPEKTTSGRRWRPPEESGCKREFWSRVANLFQNIIVLFLYVHRSTEKTNWKLGLFFSPIHRGIKFVFLVKIVCIRITRWIISSPLQPILKDSLIMEIGSHIPDFNTKFTFHKPDSDTKFIGDGESLLAQTLLSMVRVGVEQEAVIVTFEDLTLLNPSGLFTLEVYLSFLRMQHGGTEFDIPYSSIREIFVLPKCRRPFTFVVITLDPSLNNFKLCFHFESYYVVEKFLMMNPDLYAIYKDKLQPSYKGVIHEVFTTILQGLYTIKLTKPGEFRSCEDTYAVATAIRLLNGLIYPLDKCFFFLPTPPILIYYDEIDYVKFVRDVYAGLNKHRYLDFVVKLKTHKKHVFCGISSEEYDNLFDFISSKGIHIRSLESAQESHEEEQLALSSI
ncbi:unnamed protein product [Lactuca virosa]|uniref:FACT complex subunit SSRP1 n=1 Tax=Lactuca virosa TaxID=75947 RepID=A0AAU9M0Z2_9ASTR|nr:unnamed protein product [Lactuca virosa]